MATTVGNVRDHSHFGHSASAQTTTFKHIGIIQKRSVIQLAAYCLWSGPAQVGNEHNRPGMDTVYHVTV